MGRSTRVAAVVVNFNAGSDLIECLRSLQIQTHAVDEVIVVDNASTDQSLSDAVTRFPNVVALVNSTNRGFAAAANQGAERATADVLVFLNPDVSLSPASVDRVCQQLHASPGVVGMALSLGADNHELFGCTIDRLGYPTSLYAPGMPLYVPGAALATYRTLFQSLGGFDDRYFMFVEDVDFCWRALISGFEVSVCSEAQATHRGGGAATGGYVRSGRIESTAFRFVLRERNTIATMLKCGPSWWPVWLVPLHLIKTGLLIIGSIGIRRPDIARGLLGALMWNIHEMPQTYRLRWRLTFSNEGQREAQRRLYRGWLALERLCEFGVPKFVDDRGHATRTSGGGSQGAAK